jgi:hypothetical protein
LCLNYNFERVDNPNIEVKGLTKIDSNNVKEVLFSSKNRILFPEQISFLLSEYLQLVTFLNALINEYETLDPDPPSTGQSMWKNRKATCMGEIRILCNPIPYGDDPSEVTFQEKIVNLIKELEG